MGNLSRIMFLKLLPATDHIFSYKIENLFIILKIVGVSIILGKYLKRKII